MPRPAAKPEYKMSNSRSIVTAIFAGALAGLLAVMILLLVPVLGVRKELEKIVLDWQELVLYGSCLLAGTIAGARIAVIELRRQNVSAIETIEEKDSDRSISEPIIETSLAGGSKKRRINFLSEASKSRTRVLLVFLYLILFVMCAVLCQKFNLGSIVSDPVGAEIIRNVGLGLSVAGLYLMVRGLFKQNIPLKESQKAFAEVAESGAEPESSEMERHTSDGNPESCNGKEVLPDAKRRSFELEHQSSDEIVGLQQIRVPKLVIPHVPPSRLGFLKRHPVCTGWLVVLAGLPLVFQAWFPLIALPGIFIGMNWMFPEKRPF